MHKMLAHALLLLQLLLLLQFGFRSINRAFLAKSTPPNFFVFRITFGWMGKRARASSPMKVGSRRVRATAADRKNAALLSIQDVWYSLLNLLHNFAYVLTAFSDRGPHFMLNGGTSRVQELQQHKGRILAHVARVDVAIEKLRESQPSEEAS